MESGDLIPIGFIRASYGVKGYMKVSSYSGETDHFMELKDIFLSRGDLLKKFKVEDIYEKNKMLFMKLEGIDDPEAAKLCVSQDIVVPRKYAAPVKEGEFYLCDLLGCVLLNEGTERGIVKSVIDNGASSLLEVECGGKEGNGTKKKVMIPFLDPFIGDVDIKGKTIELKETWFFE